MLDPLMETWDAIRSRRNVRTYQDTPLTEAELNRILEAGRLTPSSRNEQRWDFVVVTDRELLPQLAEVWKGAAFVAGSVAAVALIAPRSDNPAVVRSIEYDLGQVTMSMMVAAADLGIGSGHASVLDQDLARRLLDLPDDLYCAWLIGLGYPDDRPLAPMKRPRRKDLADIAHWNGWEGR